MAWLTDSSFDDCISTHGAPGFLSTAELVTELQAFVSSSGMEYTAGLTSRGLGKLLHKLLVRSTACRTRAISHSDSNPVCASAG